MTETTTMLTDGAAVATVCAVGLDFMKPLLAPHARFVGTPAEADFVLAMISSGGPRAATRRLTEARRAGRRPVAWWTIEDPNDFEKFLPQAAAAGLGLTCGEARGPGY